MINPDARIMFEIRNFRNWKYISEKKQNFISKILCSLGCKFKNDWDLISNRALLKPQKNSKDNSMAESLNKQFSIQTITEVFQHL